MRAELGRKAESYLKKGAVIPDNLLVDIMLECVRYVALIQLLIKISINSFITCAKYSEKLTFLTH